MSLTLTTPGAIRVPRVIAEAFHRFQEQGSLGTQDIVSGSQDHFVLSHLEEAAHLSRLDNDSRFDTDSRPGQLELNYEGKEQLGMSHWESYRAQVSESGVLIHAASGETTQEFNFITEFQGSPAILRAGVDANEVFVDAYRVQPDPAGGAPTLSWESAFLSCNYRPGE